MSAGQSTFIFFCNASVYTGTDRVKEIMIMRRTTLVIALPLLFLALAAGAGFSQDQAKASGTAADTAKETVKGTIDFNERLGGYFIRGQEPGGEFFIVNQNPTVLKKLKESGKSVTIQGHTTSTGAEYFFIEQIDGKKYSAGKTSGKEAVPK
jgi:hypothetical protein